jgi:hypothetical protein
MSTLRKCRDCKGMINLNKENYFTERHGGRNIYRHGECGKSFLDLPRTALAFFRITLQIHLGSESHIKSLVAKGLSIVNVDFLEGVETEYIPIGEVLAHVDWSNTTPEEKEEIESKFIEAFGGGIAV